MTKSRKIFVVDGKNSEEGIISSFFELMMQVLLASGFPNDDITAYLAYDKATKYWEELKQDMRNKGISSIIRSLLNSQKKSDSLRICKTGKITHEEFSNFVFLSKEDGYMHELHTKEFLPDGISEEDLPQLIQYEDGGELYVEGNTQLSEGQLKSVVKNRKRMHVHIFEKDSNWHCFYFTFSDIKGQHWQTHHLHYISQLWTTPLKSDLLKILVDDRRHQQIGEHIEYMPPKDRQDIKFSMTDKDKK